MSAGAHTDRVAASAGAGELDSRLALTLGVMYSAFVLALLPWAREPAVADARISAVAAGAVLAADFCATLLLSAWYRNTGRLALLALACAYFYSGVMACLHVATFPGALFAAPLFGDERTVAWLFISWRLGTAALLVGAILIEMVRAGIVPPAARGSSVWLALFAVTGLCALLSLFAASGPEVQLMAGAQWTSLNDLLILCAGALCAAGIVLIVVRRAFGEPLYRWLALVLVVLMGDLLLGNAGGGRYTIGWHAARANFVVSAYLLLAFLVTDFAERGQHRRLSAIAAYGAALAATLGAVFLRWFLDPWLGANVPYITLFGAVALSVWLGGWGPGALAAALGYAMAHGLWVATAASFTLGPASLLQLALFGLSCLLIIAFGEGMRRARDRYRASQLALQERAAELQRADANKSQFLALLAHELRNPLAPLSMGLGILRMAPDGPRAAETRAMMGRQIANLTRLIDDLLDVSRIDRGKLVLHPERVMLGTILNAAIETTRPALEARSHELITRIPPEPLYLEADPLRLAQVVGNLLHNAAKFTPPYGRIDLVAYAEDGNAIVRVSDTGIGIAPEHLDKVFDLFVQVGGGRTAGTGGLGLGLSLVRSIVERHGGAVQARSAGLGQGAEFLIRIPLAAAPAARSREALTQLPATARPRRVLVVDDNTEAAESLAELLRMHGHRVETAHDGPSALRAADSLAPEVAFIDLDLPGMDGCEVVRRLRNLPAMREARLIALTGMGQQSDVQRTRDAGFDLHLTKPADPEQLLVLAAGSAEAENVLLLRRSDRRAP